MKKNESPIAYIVSGLQAMYKDGEIIGYVEQLMWISESSAVTAFDRASSKFEEIASTYSIALAETRCHIGITEVLPIWEPPSDFSIIGNRMHNLDDIGDVNEFVICRIEFLEMCHQKESNDK